MRYDTFTHSLQMFWSYLSQMLMDFASICLMLSLINT